MSVYKIFPSKDTTIYSEKSTTNAGMDAILELTKEKSVLYPFQQVGIAYIYVGTDAFDPSFDPTFSGNPASTGSISVSLEGVPLGSYTIKPATDTNVSILATNLAAAITLNSFTATATSNIVTVVAPKTYGNYISGKQLTIQIS